MTESGQKILLSNDGSWSIVQFDQKIDKNGDIIANGGTNLDAFKAPNEGKYPLTIDQKITVNNLLKNYQSDEAQMMVNVEFFNKNLNNLEIEKKEAKSSKDKELQDRIESKIIRTEASLAANKKAYKSSSNLIAKAKDLLNGDEKNPSRKIAELIQSSEDPETMTAGMGGVKLKTDNIITTDGVAYTSEKIDFMAESINTYPKTFSIDAAKYPREDYQCVLAFDDYDNNLRQNRKEVEKDFFFGYSQPKMKAYFKNDDFIKCEAAISKVGKKYYITLHLRVKSKDAKKTYGMLRANETIRFEMVDGSKVYCKNRAQDSGTIEAYTGNTLYTGIYEIEKEDIGTLKRKYLDNVGVLWSSGYEQYTIYNVDFIKNQLQCLEK